MLGTSVPRVEDPDLLRGRARFVDDIRLPFMLEAAFVRSPYAHAAIRRIDTSAALAAPGIRAVLTLDDLRPHLRTERLAVGLPSPSYKQIRDRPALAGAEVVHVGEPVAIVVADSRYRAEDAAALVAVDYEPLDRCCRLLRRARIRRCRASIATRRIISSPNSRWNTAMPHAPSPAAPHRFAEIDLAASRRRPFARMPRRARPCRSARRPAHVVELDPDAACGAAAALRHARPRRIGHPRHHARCRRRLRAEARVLSRGRCGGACRLHSAPAGEMDRGPARAFRRDDAGARPVLGGRDRGR